MSKRTVSAKGGAMSAEGHTTRRAALGALASASALVIPKVAARAATADPVLAAIERHSAAWTVVGALSPSIDDVAAMRKGRQVARAEWDAYERASASEESALDDLLATTPATAVGMRAAIAYLVSFDDGRLPDNLGLFLATLLRSPLFAV
jgi:hypothetical protein